MNIAAREATRQEVHRFTGSNPIVRYLNKRNNYLNCPKVFAQPHYHFYDDFFSLPDELYLSGYWQSEKYFASIAPLLRAEFSPALKLDTFNHDLQSRMQRENSVAVHVRRGDYSSAAAYQSFFGVLPMEYYEKAIAHMQREVKNPVFYFFSDDAAWCKQNFSKHNGSFIDHNQGVNAFKDLVLMAKCRHNIIANSTFSWWGAWLNDHQDKKVIAPEQWFRVNYLTKKDPVYPSRFYNTIDLIPASWTKI